MPNLQANPAIKAILLPKEMVLYQAVQSKMAYVLPLFLIMAGALLSFPLTWELLADYPPFTPLYPHAYHVLYTMHFSLVVVAGALGMFYQRARSAHRNHHFITNMRVVEQSKGLIRQDVQYIMLHHIKLMKVKASLLQRMTFTGKMILEDDMGLEHIEIPDIASPKDFKKAIINAKNRFDEVALRAEKDGILRPVQSQKTRRENEAKGKKEKKRLQLLELDLKQREQLRLKLLEEEELQRKRLDGGY